MEPHLFPEVNLILVLEYSCIFAGPCEMVYNISFAESQIRMPIGKSVFSDNYSLVIRRRNRSSHLERARSTPSFKYTLVL
jgi:hypothetical protein